MIYVTKNLVCKKKKKEGENKMRNMRMNKFPVNFGLNLQIIYQRNFRAN